MTDHKDFLRRARMAQLLDKDDVSSRLDPGATEGGSRDEASRAEPSPDDALVSENTLEVLKDAGHLAARLGRWAWAKTKDGCAFALAKFGKMKTTWRLRQLKHQAFVAAEAPKPISPDDEEAHALVFGREDQRFDEDQRFERATAIPHETIKKMLAALQNRNADVQEGGVVSDGMGSLPAELAPLIDLMIKPGVDFAPLEGLDAHGIAAALSEPTAEAPAAEDGEPVMPRSLSVERTGSSARALRIIRVMFVFAALLTVALGYAWWQKHGTPDAAPTPLVAPAPSEIIPTPVDTLPAPVAVPAVVDVPVEPAAAPAPVVEPPPVQLPPPARAPDDRAAKPSAASARPAVAKPKPIPTPAEEWQDKAAEDIDAWAEQMGIEPDAD